MVSVLFDDIVMVDWSASSSPTTGQDSIWIAHLDVRAGELSLDNPPTRHRAETVAHRLLTALADRRVLVGVDVPFGYPSGLAACLDTAGPSAAPGHPIDPDESPWRLVWRTLRQLVHDDERNRNNRFAVASHLNGIVGAGPGPFWGCPSAIATPLLSPRKEHVFPVAGRAGVIDEFRLTERRCRATGRRPLSVWQTAYAGSVGGQALTAIPVLERLLTDPVLGDRVEVWPFTTGCLPDPTGGRPDAVVLAEIWPSGFDLDLGRHRVKDAAQVLGTCETLAALDAEGQLGRRFAPDLDPADRAIVVAEEGWILGIG